MDGVHYFTGAALSEGEVYSVTSHWEVPPLRCIVQTQIVGFMETDDQSAASIEILGVDYVDQNNGVHHDAYDGMTSVYSSLIRFDWGLVVNNALADYTPTIQ